MNITEEKVKCKYCRKEIPITKAYICYGCMEICVCGVPCWIKYNKIKPHFCAKLGSEIGNCILSEDVEAETNVGTHIGGKHRYHQYIHGNRYPSISRQKAHRILREGYANKTPLTSRQKRYFGWIAGSSR